MNHPKIDINVQNKNLQTCLHLCILSKDTQISEFLLTYDSLNVALADSNGTTPLMIATMKKLFKIERLIKSHHSYH